MGLSRCFHIRQYCVNNVAQGGRKRASGYLVRRNATGGLIQVTTWSLSPGSSGSADAGYANYDTTTGDLYVTGGADVLAGDTRRARTHQGEGWGPTSQPVRT